MKNLHIVRGKIFIHIISLRRINTQDLIHGILVLSVIFSLLVYQSDILLSRYTAVFSRKIVNCTIIWQFEEIHYHVEFIPVLWQEKIMPYHVFR